ncbi:hypothetical protein C1645_811418 [Glomus cerebriforme]|uniref:Uncharacterized protein n=1 Tax=Glomus cerebriforme TaxID=658196 RepID=A0A397TRY0_9GLOM|nr:hypothetical protein C1645_811418 [Glomus cerebriforme]
MWYFRIHYPFKKLLEYNPKYFSKNGFIHMTEKLYKDEKFKVGRHSFHIYCINAKKGENLSSLSSDEVNKIYQTYWVMNDDTSDDKKYLGVIPQKIKNHITRQQYNLHNAEKITIINKGYNYSSSREYKEYYLPNNWIERKKEQLCE